MYFFQENDEKESYSFFCGGNIIIPKEIKNVIAIGGNITNENNGEFVEKMGCCFSNWNFDCCNGKVLKDFFKCKNEVISTGNDAHFFIAYRLWAFFTSIFILSIVIFACLIGFKVITDSTIILVASYFIAAFAITSAFIRDCIKVKIKRTKDKNGQNDGSNTLLPSSSDQNQPKIQTEEQIHIPELRNQNRPPVKEKSH